VVTSRSRASIKTQLGSFAVMVGWSRSANRNIVHACRLRAISGESAGIDAECLIYEKRCISSPELRVSTMRFIFVFTLSCPRQLRRLTYRNVGALNLGLGLVSITSLCWKCGCSATTAHHVSDYFISIHGATLPRITKYSVACAGASASHPNAV